MTEGRAEQFFFPAKFCCYHVDNLESLKGKLYEVKKITQK